MGSRRASVAFIAAVLSFCATSGWSLGPKYVGAPSGLTPGTTTQHQRGGLNDFHSQVYNEFVNTYSDIVNAVNGSSLTATSSVTVYGVTATTATVTGLNVSSVSVNGVQGYLLFYSSTVYDVSGGSATTSTAFVPTKTTIVITPKRTTSRVEITATGRLSISNGSLGAGLATIERNGTNLTSATGGICQVSGGAASEYDSPCTMNVIDIPNSVSALTYAVYMRASAGTVNWSATNMAATITVHEWSY